MLKVFTIYTRSFVWNKQTKQNKKKAETRQSLIFLSPSPHPVPPS